MGAINPSFAKQPGGGATFPAGGTPGDALVYVGPHRGDVHWATITSPYAQIGAVFDGASSVLEVGRFVDVPVPYNCTIQQVELLADQSGSVAIDIWKSTYAAFPPVVGGSIVAAAMPSITANYKNIDATLTGWTTALLAGDILRFVINSRAVITKCTIALKVLK